MLRCVFGECLNFLELKTETFSGRSGEGLPTSQLTLNWFSHAEKIIALSARSRAKFSGFVVG